MTRQDPPARRESIRECMSPQAREQQESKTWCSSKGRSGGRHSFKLLARLEPVFDRFHSVLRAASEPARKAFSEHCRAGIMALAEEPEQSIAGAPSPAGDAAVTAAPSGVWADGGHHGNG
jgi:hypothetical protein